MLLPSEIETHANLCCSYVWRSIGTHIFFEFGVPKITMLRSGQRSLTGEMTFQVSSRHWQLMHEKKRLFDSDTVTNANIDAIGKKWIVGNPVSIKMTESDRLDLYFSTKVILEIFPTDDEDDDAEVSINLPNGQWWEFDFNIGWHLSA